MSNNTQTQHEQNDEYASVEQLTVKRDEEGELLPVDADTNFGKVRVVPMPYGAVEKHFGDSGQVSEVQSDELAPVLDEHVEQPDLSEHARKEGYGGVTGEFIREELKPLVPRDLIVAILDASDVDADVMVDQQGNAQVEIQDEGNRS